MSTVTKQLKSNVAIARCTVCSMFQQVQKKPCIYEKLNTYLK